MTNPDRLAAFQDALSNWCFDGYIRFELTETAYRWVKRELESMSLKEIGRLMNEYVAQGGIIDEVRETRPEWADFDFHYDLRFVIENTPVYIESRLKFELPLKPDSSVVVVVNIHAP